jgi:hypothetical protein
VYFNGLLPFEDILGSNCTSIRCPKLTVSAQGSGWPNGYLVSITGFQDHYSYVILCS